MKSYHISLQNLRMVHLSGNYPFSSDAREVYGFFKGDSAADRAADQRANEHGRNGGDPNRYRPRGLPKKYKK
jgi:hypothetical protein